MRKGAQAWTVREFLGDTAQVRETFRKIADIGYDSVQAWPPSFMSAQELQDILQENGLVNCSGGGDFEEMIKDATAINKAVEKARIFNSRYIGIGTLPEEYRFTRDGYKKYAHALNGIASELKKEGCALLYHHHALEFISFGGGVNGMEIMAEETDPEGVNWTLDTHWLASAGVDLVYWITKLKDRLPIIHFKDYGIGSGTQLIEGVTKAFSEVGEGNINWLPVVDACRNAGVEYVIVEQDICPGDPFESLKISFENMVKLEV